MGKNTLRNHSRCTTHHHDLKNKATAWDKTNGNFIVQQDTLAQDTPTKLGEHGVHSNGLSWYATLWRRPLAHLADRVEVVVAF